MGADGWRKMYLSDIASFKTGKLNSNQAVVNGRFPFFTCSPEVLKINDYAFEQDAVILAGNNANGVFHLKRYNGKFNAYQRTYVINTKDENTVNNDFLYYQLSLKLNMLKEVSLGTATKFLTKTILEKIEFNIPPTSGMTFIAATLSCLDNKIELNNQINKTLEEMAQAIFKSWFVDFEPFQDGEFVASELGRIPKGWRVDSLDNIARFINGLAMQKYRPESETDEFLPVVKIKELSQGFTDDNSDKATNNIPQQYIVNDGDVIFSWSGTLMVKIWTGGLGGLNQHLFKVTSEKYKKWFYCFWTLKHLENFKAIAKDKATTMGHIKRSHLSEAKVLIPTEYDMQMLNSIMEPIFLKMIDNNVQNRHLKNIRDTLLPKLMSGEIRVPYQEKEGK